MSKETLKTVLGSVLKQFEGRVTAAEIEEVLANARAQYGVAAADAALGTTTLVAAFAKEEAAQAKPDFETRLKEFIVANNKLIEEHTKKHSHYYDELGYIMGKKYVKVYRTRKDGLGGRSAHCFIEIATGDIFKAASWQAPAKHARGNIYKSLTDGMGPYGAAYLK